MIAGVTVAVIAKEPVAGRVKTRLCPPCSPAEAAEVAAASLADTLESVVAAAVRRRVLVLDGEVGDWLPEGFEVVQQVQGSLGDRLEAAFDSIGAPSLVLGMDTPQVGAERIASAVDALMSPGVDAVMGGADDGGYWTIGFRRATRGAFDGVVMSRPDTGDSQLARLEELGLSVEQLGRLRDIDHWDDAIEVARHHPTLRFASVVEAIEARVVM